MSAEPAKAKHSGHHEVTGESATLPITVTGNQTSGFGFNPSSGSVADQGTVQFIAPSALWVWTFVNGTLTNVFNGQSSDHVACGAGGNNNFVVSASYSNTTFVVVGTAVNAAPPPPPSQTADTLKGTIHVGN